MNWGRQIEGWRPPTLVIDAKDGLTDQDKKISQTIVEAGKGLIVAINKWDLVEKETNTMKKKQKQFKTF